MQQQRAIGVTNEYQAVFSQDMDTARRILASLLQEPGEGAHIRPPLYVHYGSFISVGPRTFINYNLTALHVAPIVIGADCQIGPNAQLLTPPHPVEPQPRQDKLEAAKPITIGDNVWIGGGAILVPGVTIGDNSVIGAGTGATKDVPRNVVAVGTPGRVLRDI